MSFRVVVRMPRMYLYRLTYSLTACPLGNDLWLYGGEYYDGEKYVCQSHPRCLFYQDLYRYIPEKNEWRNYSCTYELLT